MAKQAKTPRFMRDAISCIESDYRSNEGILRMKERRSEMGGIDVARLVGISVHPPARTQLDRAIAEEWRYNQPDNFDDTIQELVVGAGPSAATYCAARVKLGFPRPVVIDPRPGGGSFACSEQPTFYLNSRNRPGKNGIPGQAGALNTIPGAPIQPSMLSNSEYQCNSDLAWITRLTLAMNATVLHDRVTAIDSELSDGPIRVSLESGMVLVALRVIDATGLGEHDRLGTEPSPQLLTFPELMRRLDKDPFPFRGMTKVAVIGSGDSGKTALEALLGQGPSTHWSVPGLDWIEQIDWYGVSEDELTGNAFRKCNRSRYHDLARFLPQATADLRARVLPRPPKAKVGQGFDTALVNGQPYDCAIICTGLKQDASIEITDAIPIQASTSERRADGEEIALRQKGREVYQIGPACNIELSRAEIDAFGKKVPENATAMFRYGWRTAALAQRLPAPPEPPKAKKTSLRDGGVFTQRPGAFFDFTASTLPALATGDTITLTNRITFDDGVTPQQYTVFNPSDLTERVENVGKLTLEQLDVQPGDIVWSLIGSYKYTIAGTDSRGYTLKEGTYYETEYVPAAYSRSVLRRKGSPTEARIENVQLLTLEQLDLQVGDTIWITTGAKCVIVEIFPSSVMRRYKLNKTGSRATTYVPTAYSRLTADQPRLFLNTAKLTASRLDLQVGDLVWVSAANTNAPYTVTKRPNSLGNRELDSGGYIAPDRVPYGYGSLVADRMAELVPNNSTFASELVGLEIGDTLGAPDSAGYVVIEVNPLKVSYNNDVIYQGDSVGRWRPPLIPRRSLLAMSLA